MAELGGIGQDWRNWAENAKRTAGAVRFLRAPQPGVSLPQAACPLGEKRVLGAVSKLSFRPLAASNFACHFGQIQ
jgi:hypothetical protein